MDEPVPAGKSRFELEFTDEFYAELGRAEQYAIAIATLIERVARNPYEPSLVRECFYVNPDNDTFSFRMTDCPYEISWSTCCNSSNPTSLHQVWVVKFIAATRLDD